MTERRSSGRRGRGWWNVLLLAPFVGLLWPAFYAKDAPRLGGFPFFYWYQFLWVVISVAITAAVYLATTPRDRSRR